VDWALKLLVLRTSVVVAILLIATVMVYPSRVNGAEYHTLQLALVLDGSGSITEGEWDIIIEGVAHAVEEHLVHDGSVELTVVEFATDLSETWGSINFKTGTYVPPTVITTSNFAAVANTIRGIPKSGVESATPMADGVWVGWLNIASSGNFGTFEEQIINLVTDGEPNIRWADTTNPFYDPGADFRKDVTDARNAAFAAGLDELDIEAFLYGGEFPSVDLDYLKDDVAWPQPGSFAPPFTPGWVLVVHSAQEMADDMSTKLEMLNPIPPPPTLVPRPRFVGGEVFSTNKLAVLSPYLALFSVVAVAAIVVKRRKD